MLGVGGLEGGYQPTVREYESRLLGIARENSTLKAENLEWRAVYELHISKIRDFEQETAAAKGEIEAVRRELQESSAQKEWYKGLYQRKASELASLFSSSNDQHRSIERHWEGFVEQELQLSRRVSSLQAECYDGEIADLREVVGRQFEGMSRLKRENIALKEAMLDATASYQSRIHELQARKSVAGVGQQRLAREKVCPELAEEGANVYLQRQLEIANETVRRVNAMLAEQRQQYLTKVREFAEAKGSSLAGSKAETAEGSLLDLEQISEILRENESLKEQYQKTREKLAMLFQEYPQIAYNEDCIIDFVGRYNHTKSKEEYLARLQEAVLRANCDLEQCRAERQRLSYELVGYKGQQARESAKRTQLLHKLHEAFIRMNPYFDLYRYETIGLDDSELEVFTKAGRTHEELYAEECSKNCDKQIEIAAMRDKLSKLEGRLQVETTCAREQMAACEGLRRSKERLECLYEMVMNQRRVSLYAVDVDYCNAWRQFQEREDEEKARLRTALDEMQQSRHELMRVVREREAELVRCETEIEMLKGESNAEDTDLSSGEVLASVQGYGGVCELVMPASNRSLNELPLKLEAIRSEARESVAVCKKEAELMVVQYQGKVDRLQGQLEYLHMRNLELIATVGDMRERLAKQAEKAKPEKHCYEQQLKMYSMKTFENLDVDLAGVGYGVLAGHESNFIGESTIRNFEDILKRYETEIAKLMEIYQRLYARMRTYEEGLARGAGQEVGRFKLDIPQQVDHSEILARLAEAGGQLQLMRENHSREVAELNEKVSVLEQSEAKMRESMKGIQDSWLAANGQNLSENAKKGGDLDDASSGMAFALAIINSKNMELADLTDVVDF